MPQSAELNLSWAVNMTIQKAIDLQSQIVEKEKASAELLKQLGRSLQIQEIWPEAFEAGPCYFGGSLSYDGRHKVKHNDKLVSVPEHSFTSAYFRRADNVKRYLTPAEMARFKPEIILHRDFEVPIIE